VYVEPLPVPSSSSPSSQCHAAISSYLESHGHTTPISAVRLSVLCDVHSIRRSLPSNMTLSAVISSCPAFVLVQQPDGAAVFSRVQPRAPPLSVSAAPRTASSMRPPSANSGLSNSGAAARSAQSYDGSWETYAVAVHKHLLDNGFVSLENSMSLRQLGTIQYLRALRNRSYPPLSQLLHHHPHLLVFDDSNGRPRVWARTGFPLHCTHSIALHMFCRNTIVQCLWICFRNIRIRRRRG